MESERVTAGRRLITEHCLIAADVDKTIVAQGDKRDREAFLLKLGPKLLETASLGTHLALLTGNSMDALSARVLRWLVEQLCHINDVSLLSQFHFFCNSGGVYAHFRSDDPVIRRLTAQSDTSPSARTVFDELVMSTDDKKMAIRPQFIDGEYLARSSIPMEDATEIQEILNQTAREYVAKLSHEKTKWERHYNFEAICKDGKFIDAVPEMRTVDYGLNGSAQSATVQITLRPILSFRHAHKPSHVFGRDVRTQLIQTIQKKLDDAGIGQYVARPGGRASIDITLEKLDKAYALEFLIDRLNLQGRSRDGQKYGSNAIYFGDEVIVGGGNDYPVTRIPGLLVFAVNTDKDLIPFLHHVFVPSAILEGPEATADVLAQYIRCAHRLVGEFIQHQRSKKSPRTAIEALKEEIFTTRIKAKISGLDSLDRASVDDWQTLHAFVTLMCRDDNTSRQWLSILISELDAIMTQLSTTTQAIQPALGTSYDEK